MDGISPIFKVLIEHPHTNIIFPLSIFFHITAPLVFSSTTPLAEAPAPKDLEVLASNLNLLSLSYIDRHPPLPLPLLITPASRGHNGSGLNEGDWIRCATRSSNRPFSKLLQTSTYILHSTISF
ncbi:hypothetical protein L873DRAFT_710809 [Choiromyces venosus 120613-1]|uniref:Uncharacterized protein n=1 Tax=Choiromyces venosus 120613-1 TaxID=1336337 RepID=A0A3N4K4S5_9PEZI|nr:hypothetical protein L873DRAFT_710809 [Choiromyces venosus 120613-1]